MSGEKQPNVGENMMRIHRVVTRALDVSGKSCETYIKSGFPNAATRKGYLLYVQSLVTTLHGHHTGEDELSFPCLRLKVPNAPVEKLMQEHQMMQPILKRIQGALDQLNSGSNEALPDLQKALSDLNTLWHTHIGKEEDHFSCKVLAEVMNVQEHIKLGTQMSEHAQEHSKPPFLTLPFVLYNLTPQDRAEFQQVLPPILTRVLIPFIWKRKWAPMQPFLLK